MEDSILDESYLFLCLKRHRLFHRLSSVSTIQFLNHLISQVYLIELLYPVAPFKFEMTMFITKVSDKRNVFFFSLLSSYTSLVFFDFSKIVQAQRTSTKTVREPYRYIARDHEILWPQTSIVPKLSCSRR